MRRMPRVSLTLLALTCLCGCRSGTKDHSAHLAGWRPPATNPREQIVNANTHFGLNLLHDLRQERPDQNTIISPLSLGLALAMTYNGAGSTTRTAIGKTLQVNGLAIEQVNQEYKALSDAVRHADRRVEVDIANSMWVGRDCHFLPEFLTLGRKFYDAQASGIDFQSPDAAGTINAWGSKRTKGKISEIVSQQELSGQPVAALLLDAAYFGGKWTNPFEKFVTQPRKFRLLKGQEREVPMMAQLGEYLYLETLEFQAVNLPYESGRLSFYVFLPKATDGVESLCKSVTPESWQGWMSQFAPREGTLNLPHFRVQDDLHLGTALKHLGMTDAFAEGRADFGPMCGGGVWIDDVRQRTYLYVHERGTEAAAITQMMIYGSMIMPHRDQFAMIVDHPFLFAIRDNGTGAILFMGVVVDPGNAEGFFGRPGAR
jgi:serpin B